MVMSQPAEVASLDAVRDWKTALVSFRTSAQDALVAVELAIRRAFDWLDNQRSRWRQEIRIREEDLTRAKSELWRKKNMPIIGQPDTVAEEKAVRRATARLEEAEHKLEKTRQWSITLRRAVEEYEGPGRRLAFRLEGDIPRHLALIEQKITAIEAYLAILAPPAVSPASEPGGQLS
jgi:hypothetical protein